MPNGNRYTKTAMRLPLWNACEVSTEMPDLPVDPSGQLSQKRNMQSPEAGNRYQVRYCVPPSWTS
jgi:hypothetical protein